MSGMTCAWDGGTEAVQQVRGETLCAGCRSAVADAALHDILSALPEGD